MVHNHWQDIMRDIINTGGHSFVDDEGQRRNPEHVHAYKEDNDDGVWYCDCGHIATLDYEMIDARDYDGVPVITVV